MPGSRLSDHSLNINFCSSKTFFVLSVHPSALPVQKVSLDFSFTHQLVLSVCAITETCILPLPLVPM